MNYVDNVDVGIVTEWGWDEIQADAFWGVEYR